MRTNLGLFIFINQCIPLLIKPKNRKKKKREREKERKEGTEGGREEEKNITRSVVTGG